jgi:hypothetical protein
LFRWAAGSGSDPAARGESRKANTPTTTDNPRNR